MRTDSEQQTAWTPGPWRWDATTWGLPTTIVGLDGRLVGANDEPVIWAKDEDDVSVTSGDAELIALAPEMAAAILEVMRKLDEPVPWGRDETIMAGAVECALIPLEDVARKLEEIITKHGGVMSSFADTEIRPCLKCGKAFRTADGSRDCETCDPERETVFIGVDPPLGLTPDEAAKWNELEAQRRAWDMHDPYPWTFDHLRTIALLRRELSERDDVIRELVDALKGGYR